MGGWEAVGKKPHLLLRTNNKNNNNRALALLFESGALRTPVGPLRGLTPLGTPHPHVTHLHVTHPRHV